MIINKHNQQINYARMLLDLFMVLFSWLVAFAIRFESGVIALPKGTDTIERYLLLAPILAISYFFVFLSVGVYRRTQESRKVWLEYGDILHGHALSFFVFVTAAYFFFDHIYSRVTLFLFFIISPVCLAVGRSIIRKVNRRILKSMAPTAKAIVIGSGAKAAYISRLIQERREWRLSLVARVPGEQAPEISALLSRDTIDVVFIAASAGETPHLQSIYDSLGNTVAEVIIIPEFGAPTYLSPQPTSIHGMPAFAMNTSNLDAFGYFTKRLFDITCSLGFLLSFSWLFAICALLVRLSSTGPIFYRQERMGIDGRVFQVLKFRGMYVNAEDESGPVWAKDGDSRTTPIGKWLRKTSLDEIPQFINVLKGEMSIVGPRPERPVFVHDFRHKIPGYMLRHKVKAGITGWAQINGWRGNTSLEKRIECDLWYIQNWSLWLDIKICILTPLKGFIHPHAY